MGSFWVSFSDLNDIFGDFEDVTSLDPFQDQSDTNRTGLENDIDAMQETDPFEPDDDADETFEDLDSDDVETGEAIDEDTINEVDLDFDPDRLEPDWSPDDRTEGQWDATDSSEENETVDTDHDDEPYDEWSEVSQDEEISEWNDILQDDEISQLEETGYDEPLWYDDEFDDDDPTTDAADEIYYNDWRDDLTDNIVNDILTDVGQALIDAGIWVDSLEDFLDFTEQDVSSFHDIWEGLEQPDLYDPEYPDFMADEMLELSNFVDDVFTSTMDEQFVDANPFFSWFDSFGGFDSSDDM